MTDHLAPLGSCFVHSSESLLTNSLSDVPQGKEVLFPKPPTENVTEEPDASITKKEPERPGNKGFVGKAPNNMAQDSMPAWMIGLESECMEGELGEGDACRLTSVAGI